MAALVHDVTHIPYGHTFEDERRIWDRHDTPEHVRVFLHRGELGGALRRTGVADLVEQTLARRVPFAGRPRMGIDVSADGTKIYVHVAGNTIDVYDAETYSLLRTVEFDEDMTLGNIAIIPENE